MHKSFLLIASISGALSVMIGAFGAHALRPALEASGRMDTFETAVKYQFYHTLALLAIAVLLSRTPDKYLVYSGYAMLAGILIFSGSLYILCLTGVRWLGAITPIGGVAFIAGWILLVLAATKWE